MALERLYPPLVKEEIEAEKKFTVGPQVPECHEQVDRRNRCIMALHDESNFTVMHCFVTVAEDF